MKKQQALGAEELEAVHGATTKHAGAELGGALGDLPNVRVDVTPI